MYLYFFKELYELLHVELKEVERSLSDDKNVQNESSLEWKRMK